MNQKNNFFVKHKYYSVSIAILSGILLGLSFPPSPFYTLAYVAFIPFFFLFVQLDSYWRLSFYSYIFLFVFHLVTAYWIGGFIVGKDIWMMIAGAAFLLIHPFFFLPFILLSFYVKQKMGILFGLISFALFWVSFEYIHSLGEYSFPWFTIGNSQAYDIYRIQISEYTSVYGISLLIFVLNIIAFLVLWQLSVGNKKVFSKVILIPITLYCLFYFLPLFYGYYKILQNSQIIDKPFKIGIIQPNFDPWEKWGGSYIDKWESYYSQYKTYIEETKEISKEKTDLIIWPETAIPFYILQPMYSKYLNEILNLVDEIKTPIFTGLPTVEYFNSSNAPATAKQIGETDAFVETYNSTILFDLNKTIGPIHKKTILVPFAERIPYAETFKFLIEPLKWNVGISSWGKGNDTIVYCIKKQDEEIKYSGMICYESVFPDYVRSFVKKGAEFLIIVTNDSWWGNTSGAYQHASFASIRAVETRRWVIQCANGGISLIADPTGKISYKTNLFEKTKFVTTIERETKKTFYVKYGDLFAKIIISISVVILIFSIILNIMTKECRKIK